MMPSFLASFGAALLAALFLTTGLGHVVRWRLFAALLAEHAIVPRRLVAPTGILVVLAELVAGVAALAVVVGAPTVSPRWVFAACFGLGAAFTGYLLLLLRTGRRASGCGCSPLQSPLTGASVVPALAAVVAAGLGWATAATLSAGPVRLLATLWGLTAGGLALLIPAAMPRPAGEMT